MSTLPEIEAAIEKLTPQNFSELRRWIAERDFEAWDARIEADVTAGKFDALRARIKEDAAAGKSTELSGSERIRMDAAAGKSTELSGSERIRISGFIIASFRRELSRWRIKISRC